MKKILTLLCLAIGAVVLSGCDAANDNPVSADKMDQIRKKEADERANFNPSGTPPPTGSTTGM
jgi:outer membrane lipoprotein-sorting protein